MRVACHYDRDNRRSRHVAEAMAVGISRAGDKSMLIDGWQPSFACQAAFGYGWRHPEAFASYARGGHPFVYADLGWWDRKPIGDVLNGFHKVVVNDREPTEYFRRGSPPDRLARLGVEIAPWRKAGHHVLIAGMSDKSARTRGFEPYEWERATIAQLARVTARPLVYRPKPSWLAARPLAGARFSPPTEPLEAVLRDCWAVVTLHSNVAVDALAAGIPVFCSIGVGSAASMPSLAFVDDPPTDFDRAGLLADVAYCQWSVAEIASGECWRHLKAATPLCA